jgi:2-polyprenyl-6-methoxyphenol hydroxylase-like FAD-dependent oxidoreductase
MNDDTDVLIVGAGPTGLMTALELNRHGVDCQLVEQRTEPAPYSRALVLQARSLELLEMHGIADQLVRAGYLAPGFNFGADDRTPAMVEMYHSDTRHPYMLTLSQEATEKALRARLDEVGGGIRTGQQLVGLTQQPDRVVARLRSTTGDDEHTVQARYLVDCSGAHSTVTSQLGVVSQSGAFDGSALIADVLVDGELPRGFVSLHASSRGALALIPFQDEHVRVIAFDLTKLQVPHTLPLELDDVQDTIDAIVPYPLRLREPQWITRFHAPFRLLESYRVGRVFFAGDAAHLFIPTAGQGMNTGLQDGFNIAWKLAQVCRGSAPERLLDTYQEERHAVGAATMKLSDMLFEVFIRQARSTVFRHLSTRLLGTALSLRPVQRQMSGRVSQTGVTYRATDLSKAQRGRRRLRTGLGPGDRVPDLDLAGMRGPDARLYDLLREPGYLLAAYTSSYRSRRERERVTALLRRTAHQYPGIAQAVLVLSEGLPADGEVPSLVDVRRHFREKLSARSGDLFLVRPDGYLAFRTTMSAEHELGRLLSPWLVPAATRTAVA